VGFIKSSFGAGVTLASVRSGNACARARRRDSVQTALAPNTSSARASLACSAHGIPPVPLLHRAHDSDRRAAKCNRWQPSLGSIVAATSYTAVFDRSTAFGLYHAGRTPK